MAGLDTVVMLLGGLEIRFIRGKTRFFSCSEKMVVVDHFIFIYSSFFLPASGEQPRNQ
jgi:hypothetical protein